MRCVVTEPAPVRMEIREGGGGLLIFGLPFLAAGVFVILGSLGIVTMHNEGDVPPWPALLFLGLLFATVGTAIAFGRRITSLDLTERVAITQWRVLHRFHVIDRGRPG